MFKELFGGPASFRVLVETALQEIFDESAIFPVLVEHAISGFLLTREDLSVDKLLVASIERILTGEHGEDDDTQ